MGVQLGELIQGTQLELAALRGKTIAIDAYNTIYQFLAIIRDRKTGQPLMDSKGRITSHLSGLFYRTAKFLECGIKPIYVFDGKPPQFKYTVLEERHAVRTAAYAKWQQALAERAPPEEILKSAKAAVRLTTEMVEQAKQLLDYMGVSWVQAPSEGEAQCAYMCASGQVWATASQDIDSLLFGSPRMLRNLSISGRRRVPKTGAYIEIKPELIELKKVLADLGLTREQLIIVALLVGTDYNPGVRGYGPKRALALVKKEKDLEHVLKKVEWQGPPAQEIFNFFLSPPVTKSKPEPKPLRPDKLRSLMIEEYEFSAERIDKVIQSLKRSRGLHHWV